MTEKTKRQPGYLVKIEAFVPADMTDSESLFKLQKKIDEVKHTLAYVTEASILPTRR